MFGFVISLLMTIPYLMGAESSDPAYGRCPGGWREWGDSCYMNRLGKKYNVYKAKEICRGYGGNIPSINSKPEHDFVWDQFQGSFPDKPDQGFWIDCTDKAVEGVWVCTGDGDSPYRTDWYDGHRHEHEDCAVVSAIYKFNDLNCNELRYVICERPVPPLCSNSANSCYSVFHGRCLVNHTLDVMIVERPLHCCMACNETPGCRSFNVAGGDLCELNNATRFDVDGGKNYQGREGCIYYEI